MVGPEPNGVVAVFPDRDSADAALEWLRVDGIEKRSISVLGPGKRTEDDPPELDQSRTHQREVASYWGRWGAIVGALAAGGPLSIALAVATVGIGPLALAVAAGVGAVAAASGVGALTSALVGLGIHERQAKIYEKALADGKYIIVVHSDEEGVLRTAKRELERLGAEMVEVHGIRV